MHLFQKDELVGLGIPLGEVYLLIEKFGKKSSLEDKKQKIYNLVRNIKGGERSYTPRPKPVEIQVNFKWHNFNKKKDKYTMVRAEGGGGNKVMKMNRNSLFGEIECQLKEMFFPGGRNSKGGDSLDLFDFFVADQSLNKLSDVIKIKDDYQPFTLDLYINQSHVKKPMFILATNRLSSQKFILKKYNRENESTDDDDDEFNIAEASYSNVNKKTKMDHQNSFISLPGASSSSIELNRQLIEQQNLEFQRSLELDRLKQKVRFLVLVFCLFFTFLFFFEFLCFFFMDNSE